jgi:hypothetical protein
MSHFKKLDILEKYKKIADDIINSNKLEEVVDTYFSINHNNKSFISYKDTYQKSNEDTENMILHQRHLYENLTDSVRVNYIESRIMSFNELHPIQNTSHASFNLNTDQGKYNFNHYKFYIFLSEDYDYTDKYILGRESVDFSLKKLWQYAMCLWYQRNILERKDSYPGSCTGFTDFLFYCIVNYKTRLTISKTMIKDYSIFEIKYYKKLDQVIEKEI